MPQQKSADVSVANTIKNGEGVLKVMEAVGIRSLVNH